ncbi:MAG: glycosyltransferase family 2 protein [Blastocatellales bacterium]
MSDIEISVVIPTRNRSEDLKTCIRALAAQDFPREKYEVIVCDDGSEEDISTVADEFRRSGFGLCYLRQEQRGPAAARNLGIRNARGAIVAMTDSDTLPDRSWLRRLHQALINNPDAVAVEGRVHAANEGEFDPLGEGPTNKSGGVYLTCNCAYRREALIEVGGFDETFPYAAYEDTELAARAQQIGRIVWEPEAIVVHPQRPLTLRAVMKKLKHWEYVLLMGYRYGYLAWKQYPVKRPGLRVALLSVVALPAAKFKTAAKWIGRKPKDAAKLFLFGVAESLGAMALVAPAALFGRSREKIERRKYL